MRRNRAEPAAREPVLADLSGQARGRNVEQFAKLGKLLWRCLGLRARGQMAFVHDGMHANLSVEQRGDPSLVMSDSLPDGVEGQSYTARSTMRVCDVDNVFNPIYPS